MQQVDPKALEELKAFLPCETPDAWVQEALDNQETLLINHAYLEKCAARTALNLMFKHPDKPDLLHKMSRLAREELVHFEQVMKIIKKRGLKYKAHKPSRYAGLLGSEIRKQDPHRVVDTLIVGALIEARSCERFSKLAPHLDEELEKFYTSLLKSEARHFKDYITLAEKYAGEPIDDRIAFFAQIEKEAIESPDPQFRFHSGVPVNAVPTK
ncbi:tRNA-(ms[2]io[6]A)-hydroxylase [Litoribacillus peritrichatus]|uniref:tRNA isopentenyl-2-thiomethyl-A-37 hydroxylase MiaE n=1 Tax=Litoribacillus peritrichatus TaxID=718191 RepID=A0ABP7M4D2_9GAMM